MKILNLPNILTLIRIFFIPIIILALYSGVPLMLGLAIFLGVLAYILDDLDGYIARKYNLISTFGVFFDPIVDKLLILSAFFVFVDLDLLPLWMVLLLMFREFLISGLREICSSKGKVVSANWFGKRKSGLQGILLIFGGIYLLSGSLGHEVIYGRKIIFYGTSLAVLVSFFSLFTYFWQNRDLFFE